jgi:deoxyribose-phosphate aldolase
MKKAELARTIDHTLLKVDIDYPNLLNLCHEAVAFNFASVAVFPSNVELCAQALKGTAIKVCAALAFPLGGSSPEAKAFETADAVKKGAQELDIVINVGAVKSGRWDIVRREMELFQEAAAGHTTKVILECCFLSQEEKIKACEIAKEVGVSFVKTSTGIYAGATVEDVRLLKKTCGDAVEVKAAGGIRTVEDAQGLLAAGASRLGCSAGIGIYNAWPE